MAEKVKAALKASKKLDDGTRYDVLELLGQLEGELQAKDIAIATLKSECLKHLLHNLRSDRGATITDPILALNRDATKGASKPGKSKPNATQNDLTAQKMMALYSLVGSQKSTLQRLTACLSEAETQKMTLLEDLEEERQKCIDAAASLSSMVPTSSSTPPNEPSSEGTQKDQSEQGLADELQKLKTSMASERKNTKEMILVLLEDRRKMATLYMEEKRRVDDMSRQLREEKSKVRALGMGLEEESKRSLAMEAELEHHLVQINSQADELQAERINGKELEDALRKARQDADHFKKQLSEAHRVAMSQASAAASPLYAHNAEALTASSIGLSPVPSAASISSSPMGGLTASSLVTAAMGKQSISGKYDSYSQKSRTSMMTATSTMVPRGGHRVVPNVVDNTISRMANTFQNVNGGVASSSSLNKKAPPVPPNKPAMSIYKPMSKLEGIVNSPDARSGAIDLAK